MKTYQAGDTFRWRKSQQIPGAEHMRLVLTEIVTRRTGRFDVLGPVPCAEMLYPFSALARIKP